MEGTTLEDKDGNKYVITYGYNDNDTFIVIRLK